MKFLFVFLDGVGLGESDPARNPFARAELPALEALLDGHRLVAETAPLHNRRASLAGLDANLGVPGLPQSATGQATLLTGINIPGNLGYHYGPKPNPSVAGLLHDTLFSRLKSAGKAASFLNAYPSGYFENIRSGRRKYSAIPQAVTNAGIPLQTASDLAAGRAIAADFTAQGWHDQLGIRSVPILSPGAAGERMADLAQAHDFSFFEYWLSDYAGHRQEMSSAVEILQTFDRALSGLLDSWDDSQGLVLLTSDHGNLEDLSTRRHTTSPVPALVIGDPTLRRAFLDGLTDLTGVAPAICRLFGVPAPEDKDGGKVSTIPRS